VTDRARVALLLPNGFPGLPSYRLPVSLPVPPVGVRAAVPFGAKLVVGIVASVDPEPLPEGAVEREVVAVLDEAPFLPPRLVDILLRAAAYYFVAPGELLRAAVPARLLSAGQAIYTVTGKPAGSLSPLELEIVALERATLTEIVERVGRPGLATALRRLLLDGFLAVERASIRPSRAPIEKSWRFVADGAVRGPKQQEALAYLKGLGRPAASMQLRAEGISSATLASLREKGLVDLVETERRTDLTAHAGAVPLDRTVQLTGPQSAAIEAIRNGLLSASGQTFLLDGVTGSGKTEVYLAVLEATRASGRQGLLLVPEIALVPALVRRLLARFGDRISLLHSGLSEGERAAEWERARRGEVDAVVGPRSAVFAPVPRLGLIVLDESHEASYKQAESPRYDARDLARSRARAEGAVIVMGSATPSMEQERMAREGRIPRLALPERPGARPRATVEVVDLRREKAREGDHGRVLFATRTVEILRTCFEKNEQAIVLLNRRGFSPSLLCRACGEDFRCANCSVARTYHRRHEQLICHYCGDLIRTPLACPNCDSKVLMPIGFGTERLAERFEEAFPGISHAVLDRDAAARRGGAAGVLADFESGRARALLGTQMVAKGHDFPNATALAVLDADALLSFPDFRASERTFQLVTQACGRVGRGEKPGIVAVQTARPEHEAIRAAVAQDHVAFAEGELRFRRAFRYPPYTHLLLALWTDESLPRAESAAREGAMALASSPAAKDLRLLGPAPAPLERLKGLWRLHLLVKSESREAIARAGRLLSELKEPPRLDVDPQNLL